MTEQPDNRQEQARTLQMVLEGEKILVGCMSAMHEAGDLNQGVYEMLGKLGEALQAQRVYLFSLEGEPLCCRAQWCTPGTAPRTDIPADNRARTRWLPLFHQGDCVVIQQAEALKETDPEEYQGLTAQGVHSLVAAPLTAGGTEERILGFLGVDNPSLSLFQRIAPLLRVLRFFFTATLFLVEDEELVSRLSFTDTLTGLSNRNRYILDLERLEKSGKAVGVAFMDLNGLKAINDRGGHALGDHALGVCAQLLEEFFPRSCCYRIGGDEFVVLCPEGEMGSKEAFLQAVEELKARFAQDQLCKVAVGCQYRAKGEKLEPLVRMADGKMYDDKRRFYRDKSQSPRFRDFRPGATLSDRESTLMKEYSLLMSSLNVSVSKHLFQEDFQVIWANERFYAMTGHTKEEFDQVYGNSCSAYFAGEPESFSQLNQTVLSAYEAGKPNYTALLHTPVKGGGYIWLNAVGTFTDELVDGVPVIYTVLTDVTSVIQAQREQTVANDSIPGFVTRVALEHDTIRFYSASTRAVAYFGHVHTAPQAISLLEYNLKENRQVLEENRESLLAGRRLALEIKAESIQGMSMYFQVFGDCIEQRPEGPVYLCSFIDVTEITMQRLQLQELAFVDPVTGGRNRTSFEMDAGGALSTAPGGTYALVSMDIEKFKVVNDLYGIDAGDQVLRYVYQMLSRDLAQDECACRISADTFNLLLHYQSKEQISLRISRLCQEMNQFNDNLERKYFLMFAVGIYLVEDPDLPMTQLQDRATVARKQAEDSITFPFCICRFYSQQDTLRMAEEKGIENRMWDALGAEEFAVYLQPKQDLTTGKINGAEALVRWIDPIKGLIPPDKFIPLFEHNGFVVEIDLFVFETVCRLLHRWQEEGKPVFPISVNMSRVHLNNPNFWARFEEIRIKWQVAPHLLEMELTETAVFENPQRLCAVIDEIHRSGVNCSMDDFGSGYSSLNLLKNIRVDTLKLDKAFFSHLEMTDPLETAVIGVVVELARKLKMKTVAEGVETPQQAAFLREVGCDTLQGYLFSRPLPIPQFETFAFEEA